LTEREADIPQLDIEVQENVFASQDFPVFPTRETRTFRELTRSLDGEVALGLQR
jgi:hypothetical protein